MDGRGVSLLLLACLENFSELVCEEVGHRFVLSASPLFITIATMLGWTRLSHQIEELWIFISSPHRM